jgi:hypothetical protein
LKNSGYDVVIVGGNAALCMAASVFGRIAGAKPTPLHPHPTRESRHEACRAHAV